MELSQRMNRQLGTNFTAIDLIPWVVLGVIALICFGLWFASRRRRIRK
jgi:hypothetical protein